MKHTHEWKPLFHAGATQEARVDLLLMGCRNEYKICCCGCIGIPSHGRQRGGGQRVIVVRQTHPGYDALKADADTWNAKQQEAAR